MAQIIIGTLVSLIVEAFKRSPQIPLSSGQTAALRTTAVILSFAGSVAHAMLAGDVDDLGVLGNTLAQYIVSWATYKSLLSAPKGA